VVVLAAALSTVLALALVTAESASAATRGSVTFTAYSNHENATTYPVIAHGVIHARGVDHVLSNRRDRFVFPRGALLVRHRSTSSHGSFDSVTCTGHFTDRGIWHITGGTRAYAGARGVGTYVARGVIVTRVSSTGLCLERPKLFQLTIRAPGTIRIP